MLHFELYLIKIGILCVEEDKFDIKLRSHPSGKIVRGQPGLQSEF